MIKISKNLQLPDNVVTQTNAFLGLKGSGKTYASGKLAEEMLTRKMQVIILDPVGNWYGLRLNSSGKGSSEFNILVIGGEHGDIPLSHDSGSIIAKFIVDTSSSCILDVSSFRKNQRKEFVTLFAEELFHLKKSHRSPIHLFIEEAQMFAPQKPIGQERMLGAIEDIVRLGRNYGIGCSMISQRPQSVNKEILNQAEPLFVFQLVGKHERDAVKGWIVENANEVTDMIQVLPSLNTGECFVWSPGWLRKFVRIKVASKITFDASATPELNKIRKTVTLKKIDIKILSEKMTAVIEKAQQNDPVHLKREIITLKKQINNTQTNKSETVLIDKLIKKAIVERDKLWKNQFELLYKKRKECEERLKKISHIATSIKDMECEIPSKLPVKISWEKDVKHNKGNEDYQTSTKLGKAERLILRAFYWLKDEQANKTKVSFYSGYSAGSGGFNNSLGKLRSLGLISGWSITNEGINEIPSDVQQKPTGEELREWLRPKLGKAENSILDALIQHYPEKITNEELAQISGYSEGSGGFNNSLGRLRSIEACNGYARDGGIKASDIFFDNL